MTGEAIPTPEWQSTVNSFLGFVESGVAEPESCIEGANHAIRLLLQQGMLPDLGTLQEYLSGQNACLRLVAVAMDGPYALPAGLVSIDPRNNTEKTHAMMVLVGTDKAGIESIFTEFVLYPQENIEILRHNTGLAIEPHQPEPSEAADGSPASLEGEMAKLERRLDAMMQRNRPPVPVLSLALETTINLISNGVAADLGAIQAFQHGRLDSVFELTSRPVEEHPLSGIKAIDIVTGQARPRYLMVLFGPDRLHVVDHETNITQLREETGVATLPKEGL